MKEPLSPRRALVSVVDERISRKGTWNIGGGGKRQLGRRWRGAAGYSSRYANRQGFKLLSNPEMETLTRILRRQEQDSAVCATGKVVTIPPPVSHFLRAAYLLLKVQGAFREPVEAKSDVTDLFVSTMEKIWQAENAESAQGIKIL